MRRLREEIGNRSDKERQILQDVMAKQQCMYIPGKYFKARMPFPSSQERENVLLLINGLGKTG